MIQLANFLIFIALFTGCASKVDNIKSTNTTIDEQKVQKLTNQIISLSSFIDKKEAYDVAKEAITYSKELAIEYDVVKPALFHNSLINMNLRSRGLCYHWANDLLSHLKIRKYKSFKFIKAISKRDEYFEHTSLVITRDDVKFEDSIVLDAWRDSGDLFFSPVKNDKRYDWEIK